MPELAVTALLAPSRLTLKLLRAVLWSLVFSAALLAAAVYGCVALAHVLCRPRRGCCGRPRRAAPACLSDPALGQHGFLGLQVSAGAAEPYFGAAPALRVRRTRQRAPHAVSARLPRDLVLLALPAPGVPEPLPRRGLGHAWLRPLGRTAGSGLLHCRPADGRHPGCHPGPGLLQVHPGGPRLGRAPGLELLHLLPLPGRAAGGVQRSPHVGVPRLLAAPRQPALPFQLHLPVPAALAAREAALHVRLPDPEVRPQPPQDGHPPPVARRARGLPLCLLAARRPRRAPQLLPQPVQERAPGAAGAGHAHAAAVGGEGPLPGARSGGGHRQPLRARPAGGPHPARRRALDPPEPPRGDAPVHVGLPARPAGLEPPAHLPKPRCACLRHARARADDAHSAPASAVDPEPRVRLSSRGGAAPSALAVPPPPLPGLPSPKVAPHHNL